MNHNLMTSIAIIFCDTKKKAMTNSIKNSVISSFSASCPRGRMKLFTSFASERILWKLPFFSIFVLKIFFFLSFKNEKLKKFVCCKALIYFFPLNFSPRLTNEMKCSRHKYLFIFVSISVSQKESAMPWGCF